jgi:hypothetical protein
MSYVDPGAYVEGVGVAYHPFLHDALLSAADAFDFIELPLDFYADPARAMLLDPGNRRLDEILAFKTCVWRCSLLSLGTATNGFEPSLISRLRRLIERGGVGVTEIIGFRAAAGVDFGAPQALPHTPAVADLVARRHAAAERALGVPLRLEYSAALPGTQAVPQAGCLDAAGFLALIADASTARFVLNGAGVDPAGITTGRLAGAVVRDGIGWDLAAALARRGAATIIVRRTRNLFPLDNLRGDLRRARSLTDWHQAADAAAEDIATLAEEQARLAADCPHVGVWRNWRTQVDDTYKAMQIATMLAQRTRFQAPERPS